MNSNQFFSNMSILFYNLVNKNGFFNKITLYIYVCGNYHITSYKVMKQFIKALDKSRHCSHNMMTV